MLPPTGLLATGLFWNAGSPAVTAADPAGVEREIPLLPGAAVGWRLRGPRRCVGIWRGDRRQMCPHRAAPKSGAAAQCEACAAADPGRALARDARLDDDRDFALYLAWFGPGLLKIGISAAERGTNRLAEQGAVTFTWLGRGPLTTVRRAEILTARAGQARERLGRTAKVSAWWRLGAADDRAAQLTSAYEELLGSVEWPDGLVRERCQVQDLAGLFGLTDPVPVPQHEITALDDGTVLAGSVVCIAGRDAVLATTGGPLLLDLRLLAGWILTPADGHCGGIQLAPFTPVRSRHDDAQDALF
jgi:hypothetical protein